MMMMMMMMGGMEGLHLLSTVGTAVTVMPRVAMARRRVENCMVGIESGLRRG
jgi:hypothetical protein